LLDAFLHGFSRYCAACFSELSKGGLIRAALCRVARACIENFADRRTDREKIARSRVRGNGLTLSNNPDFSFRHKKEAQEQTEFQIGGVYNIDERVTRATGTARKNSAGDSGII